MFCVISVWSRPERSRSTSARCPAFGSAANAGDAARLRHARSRTAGSAR